MTYDEAIKQLEAPDALAVEMIDASLFTGDAFIRADNRIALRVVMARWGDQLRALTDADYGVAPEDDADDRKVEPDEPVLVQGEAFIDVPALRDQIAMRVLQGEIANSGMSADVDYQLIEAKRAYQYADAMLKAREGA